MPIFVPPSSPEPDITLELAMQRRLTEHFILYDPMDIALTPITENRSSSGAVTIVNGAPRPLQVFRLIPMSHIERPERSAGMGQQRKHEFTLLGLWDAIMAEGDWWEDERDERWVIDELVPHNGYETRGLVTSYGRTK